MDGYAIRIQDLKTSTVLPLAGKSFAGQPFEGEWPQGTCVRIMTGAQIPHGCDAVIMQENTEVTDSGIQFNQKEVEPQNNIRPTGDDIKQGDLVLAKGARLTPRDIPMIASLGVSHVTAGTKAESCLLLQLVTNSNHWVSRLNQVKYYDSNRYGIKPLIEHFGCGASRPGYRS